MVSDCFSRMHSTSKRIAIIGGGPAGAFAAAELARGGLDVLVFDEKLAWEKPCGGGITPKAITRWPFLRDALADRNWITHCEITAPSGRKVAFPLDSQIAIFSRLALNGLMLEKARNAGVQVLQERIVNIGGAPGNWSLSSSSSRYEADFVVLAAGARNPFRGQFSHPGGPKTSQLPSGITCPEPTAQFKLNFYRDCMAISGYFRGLTIFQLASADECREKILPICAEFWKSKCRNWGSRSMVLSFTRTLFRR